MCGTEEVYFHSFNKQHLGIDGGIMITASHNPKGYNGMKMVKSGSKPISGSDELKLIHDYILENNKNIKQNSPVSVGKAISEEDKSSYVAHLLEYVNLKKLKTLKIVVNSGNGSAGPVIRLLEKFLPFEFIYMNEKPDGSFPNGVPNPMILENQISTSKKVVESKADIGIAWDGDFDRCFLFDENGKFIEGYYVVGLLAKTFLNKHKGAKIIHDPRLIWNSIDIIRNSGGIAVQSKSGHSFIKEKMRKENAIYGGEMSAHHYFKDFAYCDSGMIPWLLIVELLSASQNLDPNNTCYASPCSGEINYKVSNGEKTIAEIEKYFKKQGGIFDYTDGISVEFSKWRFNIRKSNTEPLIRLNLEVKGREESIKERLDEIESIISSSD